MYVIHEYMFLYFINSKTSFIHFNMYFTNYFNNMYFTSLNTLK